MANTFLDKIKEIIQNSTKSNKQQNPITDKKVTLKKTDRPLEEFDNFIILMNKYKPSYNEEQQLTLAFNNGVPFKEIEKMVHQYLSASEIALKRLILEGKITEQEKEKIKEYSIDIKGDFEFEGQILEMCQVVDNYNGFEAAEIFYRDRIKEKILSNLVKQMKLLSDYEQTLRPHNITKEMYYDEKVKLLDFCGINDFNIFEDLKNAIFPELILVEHYKDYSIEQVKEKIALIEDFIINNKILMSAILLKDPTDKMIFSMETLDEAIERAKQEANEENKEKTELENEKNKEKTKPQTQDQGPNL